MRLGLVGRGPWGQVYARTLRKLEIPFWQAGRDLNMLKPADGVIIASAPHSHTELAEVYLELGVPVLIEKPVTLRADDARMLLEAAERKGGIAFVGHTRLYSPVWREFKKQALEDGVESVYAIAGGPCKIDPWLDWGSHLAAMCLDLGFDPSEAAIYVSNEDVPLHLDVNDGSLVFGDCPSTPTPLEVLISEFVSAIKSGKPDYRGLELGVKVMEYLQGEKEQCLPV